MHLLEILRHFWRDGDHILNLYRLLRGRRLGEETSNASAVGKHHICFLPYVRRLALVKNRFGSIGMDCHSDFFSLLSLSQLNSSSSLNLATSCSACDTTTGVAPSLDGRGVYHTVSGLLQSPHNNMAHAHSLSPVLVASQHSVKDIDMIDGSSASNVGSVLSGSCRKFSGLKRKRDGQGLAVGDDVCVAGSTDYWAAMPMANDLRDEGLQPNEQKVSLLKFLSHL